MRRLGAGLVGFSAPLRQLRPTSKECLPDAQSIVRQNRPFRWPLVEEGSRGDAENAEEENHGLSPRSRRLRVRIESGEESDEAEMSLDTILLVEPWATNAAGRAGPAQCSISRPSAVRCIR